MELNLQKRQKIAWRLKQLEDCPELLTYHDIKDALDEVGYLKDYFLNKDKYKNLFVSDILPQNIYESLDNLSINLDLADRRRIALFHGIVQYPQTKKILNKEEYALTVKNTIFNDNKRNELSYIFMNSLVSIISDDDKIVLESRKNLKMISDLMEEGYEEGSLFSQYMMLNEKALKLTEVSTYSVARGKRLQIDKLSALKILFDFNDEDFQDVKWVGGGKKFDYTAYLSLRKRKIHKQIDMLRVATFQEALNLLD